MTRRDELHRLTPYEVSVVLSIASTEPTTISLLMTRDERSNDSRAELQRTIWSLAAAGVIERVEGSKLRVSDDYWVVKHWARRR